MGLIGRMPANESEIEIFIRMSTMLLDAMVATEYLEYVEKKQFEKIFW